MTINHPFTPRNRQIFRVDACTRCGDCLSKCPELQLPRDLAQKEIQALIDFDTKGAWDVLTHCTTCFSCNLICPHDCKPYQLILENWNTIYRQRGAPPIYRFVCPTMDKNIWQMLLVMMPDAEKQRVTRWMQQDLAENILLVGNYTHLLSFILDDSKLLNFFTPVDLIDEWEGGAYLYQGGYLDVVKRIAEKCYHDFHEAGVKRVTPVLAAVHHIFTEVHPNEMGVQHTPEFAYLDDFLIERIDRGDILLSHPIDMTVTIHDNCYSKVGREAYWDPPREILKRAGCTIKEMRHIRANSLCCGFGQGASWEQNFRIPFDILGTARVKFQEAEATGAEALVTYCGGCLYLLWAAKELFQSPLKVFHHLELLRMAMGEPVDRNQVAHVNRAWDVITIITYHLVLSMVRKPFWIQEVSFDQKPFKPKKFVLIRIIRKLFDISLMRAVYRKLFNILLPKLRTKRRWE